MADIAITVPRTASKRYITSFLASASSAAVLGFLGVTSPL